jgi:hypothetical protein
MKDVGVSAYSGFAFPSGFFTRPGFRHSLPRASASSDNGSIPNATDPVEKSDWSKRR